MRNKSGGEIVIRITIEKEDYFKFIRHERRKAKKNGNKFNYVAVDTDDGYIDIYPITGDRKLKIIKSKRSSRRIL